jgi:hypothetical protein
MSIFWDIMLCNPLKVNRLSMDYVALYPSGLPYKMWECIVIQYDR